MKGLSIAVIVILSASVISIVVITFLLQRQNAKLKQTNIQYPFSGKVDPKTGIVTLKNSTGGPQIDCSVASGKNGGKINIIGSFTDIVDPYGTCSPHANSLLNVTCGIPGGNIVCQSSNDCGPGMSCSGGFCVPASAQLNGNVPDSTKSQCGGNYCPIQPGIQCSVKDLSSCNDPNGNVMQCISQSGGDVGTCQVIPGKSCMGVNTTYNTCALYPLCSNLSANGFLNKTASNMSCDPNIYTNNPNVCRPRDSSAYLAGMCDGKTTCNVMADLTSPGSGFGPTPCNFNISSTAFNNLPIIPGDGGNYNQGYYVHGIYTCILDD